MARRYWVKIGGRKHALTRKPTRAELQGIANRYRQTVTAGFDEPRPRGVPMRRNPEALIGLQSAADLVKAFGDRMYAAGRHASKSRSSKTSTPASSARRPAKPKSKHSPNKAGFDAAVRGRPLSANPHPHNSLAYRMWENGWYRFDDLPARRRQ